jgi:hypothetical protein
MHVERVPSLYLQTNKVFAQSTVTRSILNKNAYEWNMMSPDLQRFQTRQKDFHCQVVP